MDRNEAKKATERLLEVMDTLRRECPWDREQTFDSLRNNTIEETYELADAITERTKVVLPVDLGGVVCDYDKIFAAVESKKHLFKPTKD